MKFGVNMYIWAGQFDESSFPLLDAIKEHGFDGVEFPVIQPAQVPAAKIRQVLEEHALDATTCGAIPRGMSLIAEDRAVRAKTLAYMRECIATAAACGAKIFAGPMYSPIGELPGRRRTAEEWQRAVESYQELGPALAEYGVTLALEPLNRFEAYFLNTARDAAALAGAIGHPNVGILFDTFHANIEEKDVAAGLRTVGRHLKHAHASENDRGTPGTGHVDWRGVMAALHTLDYDGWFTIESFGFSVGELSAAASIWRDLAPSPEAIAFEGLRFLKELDQAPASFNTTA
ncbi:MAG TPA: sugar phosphate isomerase/epimerase family protein [Bryobacteraceae bacterium]|nr:sugar phosphate isomerase/epimerase family protein [Bryobacteraceae bacterium]